MLDYVRDAFQWIWEMVLSILHPLWAPVANAVDALCVLIASGLASWNSVVGPYLNVVNAWVPLDFGINCLIAYYSYLAILVGFRWILKFIPTIG